MHRFTRFSLAIAWTAIACGGRPTLEKVIDGSGHGHQPKGVQRLVESLPEVPAPHPRAYALGLSRGGLVGRQLPDGPLWQREDVVDVLPTLAGDWAFYSGDGRLSALDLQSGALHFSIDVGGRRLEGASFDGAHAVLLLVDEDDARKDMLMVLTAQGQVLHEVSVNARLGTPLALGGVGLVPYNGRYILAFDLLSGDRLGRSVYLDDVHTVAKVGSEVLILGRGATAFSERLVNSAESHSLRLPPTDLPGNPIWPENGSEPRPARGQPIGIYAYPMRAAGELGFAQDRYVATYFEIVVGLDAGQGKIRWVNHLPQAVAGGAAGADGPSFCLENGDIFRADWKTGELTQVGTLNARLNACTLSPSLPFSVQGKRAPLFEQIVDTLAQTGQDMASFHTLLLRQMAKPKTASATKALLAVAQHPLVSSDLSRQAGRLLAKQRSGGGHMVRALVDSAPKWETDSWLLTDSRRAPPVAQLARALVKIRPEGAAGALSLYLSDPSLAAGDIDRVMEAIALLGTVHQVGAVWEFLLKYKNTGGETRLIDALTLAAEFVYHHLDDEGRTALLASLNQSLTHPDLRKSTKALAEPTSGGTSGSP